VLDLFPVGLHQLQASIQEGYAYARSQEYLGGTVFQTLTWLRSIGVAVFVIGGVLPLIWFMLSRSRALKPSRAATESYVVPPTVLADATPSPERDN